MPPGNVLSYLEELCARIDDLERRIAALEIVSSARTTQTQSSKILTAHNLHPVEAQPASLTPSLFSILGRSILGIAGAYLFRAAAESRVLPTGIVLRLALAYAAGWLVWAAWSGTKSRIALHAYAVTAALILSPMLWEITVRFKLFAPGVSAAVLAGFAGLAVALGWRFQVSPVIWTGMLASSITSLALMIGTRTLVPFTWALLFMAALTEIGTSRGRWHGLRPVVAAAADSAAFILIVILGNAGAIPAEYHAERTDVLLALVLSLWAIYAVSLAVRSLRFHEKVSVFDISQSLATALLAGWAVLRITHGGGLRVLGIFCLIVGAACYLAMLSLFARHGERRNVRFYGVCGLAFVVAGSFWTLPHLPLVVWLCTAAAIATGAGVRSRNPALDIHGVAYLCAALYASGLLEYAGRALAGASAPLPDVLQIVTATAAVLCAVLLSRYPGERTAERLLRILPVVVAVYATAGLAVSGLVWLIARAATPALSQLAVIRTIVTGAAALGLACIGAQWKRLELVWLAYAATVLGGLKLVIEDLRIGSTQSLAVSLVIFGAVLILIPRLVRTGKRPA